jgi:hypothetical protein
MDRRRFLFTSLAGAFLRVHGFDEMDRKGPR